MTICSLCSPALSRPSKLPTLPESWNKGCSFVESSSTPYFWAFKGNDTPPEEVGLPHHAGLDALKESAKECPLCEMILERVDKFIEGLERDKQEEHERYFVFERQRHGIPEKWTFSLVQRLDDADGFCVLADSTNRKYLYLMDAFGFCVDSQDSLYSTKRQEPDDTELILRGSKVEPDAGAEDTLSVVTGWLNDCEKNHTTCRPTKTRLPSRILDLDALNDVNKIRLLETRDTESYDSYVTLSYCWGSDPSFHVRTTHATMSEHLDSIDVDSLPQTYKDAIKITRHLGIRYLWIDSLCICQDDVDDWARESAAMQQVYAGAYLSIAADSAAGSEQGFLKRPGRKYVPVTLNANFPAYAFQIPPKKACHARAWMTFDNEPLTKRGWAEQERLLPYRALHFGNDQMFFECNCHLLSEDGVEVKGRWNSLYPSQEEKGFKDIARKSRVSMTHQQWYLILENFFHRDFTVKTDRLPAISGLASLFQKRLAEEMGRAEYVAGLWSNALVEGLEWSSLGSKAGEDTMPDQKPLPGEEGYIAPTWSPASFVGVSAHGMTMPGWVDIAQITGFHTTPKTMQNPLGELVDGWVSIRGPMIKLHLSDLPDEDQAKLGSFRRNIRLCTPSGDDFGGYSSFDGIRGQNDETRAWVKNNEIFALIMAEKKFDEDGSEKGPPMTFHSLLVMPVGEKRRVVSGRNEYMRVGTFFLDEDDLAEDRGIVRDVDGFAEIVLV
ncbi:heterokaryon incompatibility protein-domain-containing protein [Fusarium flagelliforme]|uniref:Het-domain-containing protein n=1 Tax=Fusarium flagelliforme TaxID=2675880 RepID=A0A395MEL5_9HYPO|nr:heterokaryon incompatibility protein-domain-containing protein [Fusarium flagelliforme]KAH7179900.1 heterokaryon incompatibility protein-domain-containing protein [Fusarium flagelliforme]RFN45539.1 het-domain-containing protein [Fusarium flagelliforme]